MHPENVFLLRGNHEDAMLAQAYGFYDELMHKFGKDDASWLWPGAYRVFASLPLAARTHEAFVVHGGLPTAQFDLDELAAMPPERRMYPSVLPSHSADESQAEERDFSDQEDADDIWLMQGLLWSDPSDEECGVTPNLARGDAGVVFGVDVSSQWLKRYGLKYLVRSHEVALSGCNVIECGAGDDGVERFVYTVFSAADYPDGQGYNKVRL